jgi:hypothetical protein
MIILLTLLFVFLLVLTRRVKRLVWEEDKVLPLMMVCFSTSAFWLIVFYVNIFYTEKHMRFQYNGNKAWNCANQVITFQPSLFLGFGVALNFCKWAQYLIKVVSYVEVNEQLASSHFSYQSLTQNADRGTGGDWTRPSTADKGSSETSFDA